MRPRATWMVAALCLALLGGAMAWITRSMLHMEDGQNRMANEAMVQEMARLSLWRMEGIASSLVITESARPPEQYRTFTTPEALLDNKTLSTVNEGDVVALSPLLREPSDLCTLYFEMDADGKLRSPQVPVGRDLLTCQTTNALPQSVVTLNTANLAALDSRIARDDTGAKLKEMREKLRVPVNLTGNRALMWSWNAMAPDDDRSSSVPETPAVPPASTPEAAPPPSKDSGSGAKPGDAPMDRAAFNNEKSEAPANYAMQQRAAKPEQVQSVLNSEEAKARQEFVQSGVGKAASRRSSSYENSLKQTPKNDAARADGMDTLLTVRNAVMKDNKDEAVAIPGDALAVPQPAQVSATRTAVAGAVSPPAMAASPAAAPQVMTKRMAPPPQLPEAAAVREVPAAATPPAESPPPGKVLPPGTPATPPASSPAAGNAVPQITDFRPLWLGDALLLTRRVTTPERQWIQGAWLDWDKLRAELLEAVKDRFPAAKVVKAPENPEPGAHLLASLPVQLIPGAVTFPAAPFWTPLRVSLSIAWLCVLLAVAAVALVLRGMMSLSERRASFVSSVTHELRTPLATFKLYSEMLADGMVKEEAKKQQYLETLTGEADRLGHLVENVLAYSRIERGKGPTAAASVRTGELVDRVEPRLNQRTLMAGLDFGVTAAPGTLEIPLRTDAGAVEQILCNLVDNACKYGRRDGAAGKVELVISRERRRLCLAVRDYGPGIAKGDQNAIFLPFHKSAREAAHSAPGVGLGLALCRRLACELRGTLEIDRSWKQGACFVLRLPV